MDFLIDVLVVCLIALCLDRWLGEPRRWHPLVGFGRVVSWLEQRLNRPTAGPGPSIGLGLLALVICTLPPLLLTIFLVQWLGGWLGLLVNAVVLWLALSLRGLAEHGYAVSRALHRGDVEQAREQVSRIVSRDATKLDAQGVASAATESMLENGADAVFASLFWYLVAGLPGVVLHRIINTLDAMWGYRNDRYRYFGRTAARLDDLMNWLPARLTALTYSLLGNRRLAWHCWRTQARQWDSPNAGPVMAAGAGALEVSLGGPAPYAGGVKSRPVLGQGAGATAATVEAAIRLVQRGVWLWLGLMALGVLSGLLLSGDLWI